MLERVPVQVPVEISTFMETCVHIRVKLDTCAALKPLVRKVHHRRLAMILRCSIRAVKSLFKIVLYVRQTTPKS